MSFRVIPFRDRLLNRVIKATPMDTVRRGEKVVTAGTEADTVILAREGHLALRTGEGRDGRSVDVVLPWEVAGMEAVMNGDTAYRWSVVAEERSRIQRLDSGKVRRVLKRSNRSLDAFLSATNDRLELLHALGHGGSACSASERLWTLLRHLAARVGDEEEPGHFPYHLTHRTLGDLAGLHRSTVTTILNDWIYRGAIEDAGRGWRITSASREPPG